MKILIISQYWAPEDNVPARRWQWLAEILVNQGHEVTVLAPPPHYQRRITTTNWLKKTFSKDGPIIESGPVGETIVRTAFFPSGVSLTKRVLNQGIVAFGALTRSLAMAGKRSNHPDLIIGTVPALPTAAVTTILSRFFEAPYVIDLRDAWPDLLSEAKRWNDAKGSRSLREKVLLRGPFQILAWLTERTIYWSLRNAAAITVTSGYLAEDLIRRKQLSERTGALEIRTIRNVFPPEVSVRGETKNILETSGEKLDRLKVLYAGTIGRAQNLGNAIEAVALAKEMGLQVDLTIVGTGVAKSDAIQKAERLKVNVNFVGRKNSDELRLFYRNTHTALVHLTDWEALSRAVPSKTYELMMEKIHITAVVKGEAAALVSELDAGTVVQPEDPKELARCWIRLAENPSLLKVGDKAADWVAHEREVITPRLILELLGKLHDTRE